MKHSSARIVVERTIGVLKARFRCLQGAKVLHYKPEKATQIVNVCASLYNICIFYKTHMSEEIPESEIHIVEDLPVFPTDNDNGNEGNIIRNGILRHML